MQARYLFKIDPYSRQITKYATNTLIFTKSSAYFLLSYCHGTTVAVNVADMKKSDSFHKYQINATQLKQPPSLQTLVLA
jgi:hypothetical protein